MSKMDLMSADLSVVEPKPSKVCLIRLLRDAVCVIVVVLASGRLLHVLM